MMKNFLRGFALAALVAASPAMAADLAATYKAAPAVMTFNWTGFYVGLNGGGGMAAADHLDPDGGVGSNTKFQQAFGTVGAQAGYNYQIGSSVIGLEGDYNWVGLDKTKQLALTSFGNGSTANFKFSEFATLRARGGLALDRTLLYVTAGVAFAHIQNTDNFEGFDRPAVASEDKWKAGLAVGAGVEFALSQTWSVKGEYLYMMFEDSDAPLLNPDGTRTCVGNTPGSLRNCRMN